MSRKNLSEEAEMRPSTLDELVVLYAEDKKNLDNLTKVCDSEKAEIKRQLETAGKKEHSAGGYTVKYVVSSRETMNEDKLLEVIKKFNITGVIKTKEYVDMDALESYLYNHELSANFATELDRCRDKTPIVQLRLSKTKQKKED